MRKGAGPGRTRADHLDVAAQLLSALARARQVKELAELVGLTEGERARVRRTLLGFVFQEHLLLPELTAVENAALPLLLTGMRRPDAERHATDWLAALGLAGM